MFSCHPVLQRLGAYAFSVGDAGENSFFEPFEEGKKQLVWSYRCFLFSVSVFFKGQVLRDSWLVGRSWENSFFESFEKKEGSNGVIVKPASV